MTTDIGLRPLHDPRLEARAQRLHEGYWRVHPTEYEEVTAYAALLAGLAERICVTQGSTDGGWDFLGWNRKGTTVLNGQTKLTARKVEAPMVAHLVDDAPGSLPDVTALWVAYNGATAAAQELADANHGLLVRDGLWAARHLVAAAADGRLTDHQRAHYLAVLPARDREVDANGHALRRIDQRPSWQGRRCTLGSGKSVRLFGVPAITY